MDARLIIHEPASGAWNMAVDETLLAWAGRTGGVALRFYQWREPTISLGYFQSHGDRQAHRASSNLACVRRTTGGGAIVHHHELTYSFVAPLRDRFSNQGQQFVRLFHEALAALLSDCGSDARLVCETESAGGQPPFLCFQRRCALDVVLGGYKVLGSAQRRYRGALLQHGSLLLAASPHASELKGLRELAEIASDANWLARSWATRLEHDLNLTLLPSVLSERELAETQRAADDRFAHPKWNRKR